MEGKLYFAYGSNINLDQMAHRCPRSKVVGPVVLENYELLFRGMGTPPEPSEAVPVGRGGARERAQFSPHGGNGAERTLRRRGCGVATISPREGSQVQGLLWKITPESEQALDFYEGFPRLYRKENLTVKTAGGDEISVMAYVMTREKVRQPTMPSPSYYVGILEGFQQNGLPERSLTEALEHTRQEIQQQKKKGRDTYER